MCYNFFYFYSPGLYLENENYSIMTGTLAFRKLLLSTQILSAVFFH